MTQALSTLNPTHSFTHFCVCYCSKKMKVSILPIVLAMLAKGGLATQVRTFNADSQSCLHTSRIFIDPHNYPSTRTTQRLRHLSTPLAECEYDCDSDDDCQPGLLCADDHKTVLEAAGLDKRKANCPAPHGTHRLEVCYDPGTVLAFTLNTRTYNTYFPYPQYLPLDPTDPDSPKFLRLTSDGYKMAGVSAFTKYRFDPDNTEKGFSMMAEYRMQCNQEDPKKSCTDGLAFVMHQDHRGAEAVGWTSKHMGVYDDDRYRKGEGDAIRPSLIVELDRRTLIHH